MSQVHIATNGKWAACEATQRACPRTTHAPFSLRDWKLVPDDAREMFIEIMNPADETFGEDRFYYDHQGLRHRDGDKPAAIYENEHQYWVHGRHVSSDFFRDGRWILSLGYSEEHPSPYQNIDTVNYDEGN